MVDITPNKSAKRKLILADDEDDDNRVYKFKVLLPNGLTVELRLDNPGAQLSLENLVKLVREQYVLLLRKSRVKPTRNVDWKSEALYFEDSHDRKIRQKINFMNYRPYKCHVLRLYDGSSRISKTYEVNKLALESSVLMNMWDLTPHTDLLKELPEAYDFESALADLIDNSLQAVWSNGENDRRLISVNIVEDRICIFDTGPGMDSSEENSIEKWGKMGASLHRSSKPHAIGGRPPYLTPYFGMFGYGGPIASMHMGRKALVASKTKRSSTVYLLHLQREALLKKSNSEQSWKTSGGTRNPSEDEVRESPHGSFTKVEISELKLKRLTVTQLQCKIKDIYFPYIQCDEMSGKTTRPIEFLVNGTDLAEITSGEVTVTNLLSCNGPEFVFQLKFASEHSPRRSPGFTRPEANARLKCVYFPFYEGKENIERILEQLEEEGCGLKENFNSFSRVSVRRLGRLLPDARWGVLPFMEYAQKRGDKARLLKSYYSRVKCFIDTDAGFNPTPSKTDLAQHCVFSAALRNLGTKADDKGQDVKIEISQNGKRCTISHLETQYQEWILQMHERYDKEIESGDDDAVMVVSPPNKKKLGISSDVFRVHKILRRKGASWKAGQHIKILKGAADGFHKNNVYATIEHFLIEGMHGDAGGDARIICRPFDVAEEKGSQLVVGKGDPSLVIDNSVSVPINVIDSGKCVAVGSAEWASQLEKKRLKAPSSISLLCLAQCRELDINEALPVNGTIDAGQVPPRELVAVARPASYNSENTCETLDQKYIAQTSAQMSMVVEFSSKGNSHENAHLYSIIVSPTSRKGVNGLYFFRLPDKLQDLFKKAGLYTFLFSLTDSSCKTCEKKVAVIASPETECKRIRLPSPSPSPSSNGKHILREDDSPCTIVHNLALGNPTDEKKLVDDICALGKLVGDLESELKQLRKEKAEIEQEMSKLQEDHSLSIGDCLLTKEEVEERIARSNSASAIVSHLSRDQEPQFCGGIIGLVVQLGTVSTSKLGSILAEYLGEDQMLAVVCRSFRDAITLEKYRENGDIDYESGVHAQAAALGRSINGRFNVICLEDLWPQGKLKLDPPITPNGETRPGFLGYAVNMVEIDRKHVGTRNAGGHGLRETLFYHLFGKLQVYETRELMYSARQYGHIGKEGAVSLDGGILRANGVASLGQREPSICFPVVASGDDEMCLTMAKHVRDLKAKVAENARETNAKTEQHAKAVKKIEKKKEKIMRQRLSQEV